jgi:hypothetical protein
MTFKGRFFQRTVECGSRRRTARDPALRARISEANKQKCASFYTIEHDGQRMAAVFDELLSRRKRGGV